MPPEAIQGSANQDLPGGFRSVARVDYFSSFDFQQSFQESFDRATQRSKRASGTIVRSFREYNLRVLFDRNDTSFGDNVAVREVLPQLTFGSRASRLGPTPILFSFDSEASRLGRTISGELKVTNLPFLLRVLAPIAEQIIYSNAKDLLNEEARVFGDFLKTLKPAA